MAQSQQFDLNAFFNQLQQSDQDYVLLALQSLYDYLLRQQEFHLQNPEQFGRIYIASIIQRLSTPLHTEIIIRLIPQFAAKLPIQAVPFLYEKVFDYISQEAVKCFSNIGGVLEDSILNANHYSEERQETLVKCLFSRLVSYIQSGKMNNLANLSLKLLTTLIVTVPFCLNETHYSTLKTIIEELVSRSTHNEKLDDIEYLTLINSISSLAKVYCTIVDHQTFLSMLDYIHSIENVSLSTYIFSNIIIYRPQLFDPSSDNESKYSYSTYADIIMERLTNDHPEDEQEASKRYITFTITYLDALRSIVSEYGARIGAGLDPYLQQHFSFLSFNAHPIYEAEENDTSEVGLGDDDEEEEPVDNVFDVSDDSYRIRTASISLGIELVKANKDLYYESISYYDEEEDINSAVYIDDLIHDSDIGCQLPALEFLRVLIHAYKDKLEDRIVIEWSTSVLDQITTKAKDENNCQFIEALAFIISERKSLPSIDIVNQALTSVESVYNNATANSIFHLLSAILLYSKDQSLPQPISSILTKSLNDQRSNAIKICLSIVSRLYLYYHQHCQGESSISKLLNNLNQIVLGISSQQGEIKIYSVMALSVFVVSCPNESTIEASVNAIVETFKDSAYTKSTIPAIALITASNHYSVLSQHLRFICEQLCNHLHNFDSTIVYRSLWSLNLLIQQKLLTKEQSQQVSENLLSIIESEFNKLDSNTLLLIVKNLRLLQPEGYDSENLLKFKFLFTTSKLDDVVMKEVCYLINESSKVSLSNVKPLLDFILQESRNFQDIIIIRNNAAIIGFGSYHHSDYLNSLLETLIKDVNRRQNVHFSLRCIGEIGSHIDLLSHESLVNSLFELVKDSNREIFVPCSECIGLISIGSKSILERMLQQSQSEPNLFHMWLIGYQSLIKKCNRGLNVQENLKNVVSHLGEIKEYLLNNSSEGKETSMNVSQCLAGLIGLSDNPLQFSQELIQQETPIIFRAIDFYMENYSKYETPLRTEDKEEIDNLLQSMSTIINSPGKSDDPILCQNFFMCLRYALQNGVEQELNDEVFDQILLGATKNPNHLKTESQGLVNNSIDVGIPLRSIAFECGLLLLKQSFIKKSLQDLINITNYVYLVNTTLIEEPSFEIREKCLDNVSFIASIPLLHEYIQNDVTIQALIKIDQDIISANPQPSKEVIVSFFNALLSLRRSYGQLVKLDLDNLYERHQDDQELIRLSEERAYSKNKSALQDRLTSLGYASSILMSEFYPSASDIFA